MASGPEHYQAAENALAIASGYAETGQGEAEALALQHA